MQTLAESKAQTADHLIGDRDINARADSDRHSSNVTKFKYSVVVPVFNGADKIDELFNRIAKTFNERNCSYEIVIVNDGSTDDTWTKIVKAAVKNRHIVAINLTRNFGQHPAVLCGLANSSGDYVLTIDADLQNPPEELFKLIEPAVENDYELVFAKFTKKQHAFYRRLGSIVISYLNQVIFAKPKSLSISNVRLMNRDLVARICQTKTAFPYINGLALRCADPGKCANVFVEHHKRIGSDSTYTPLRIAKLVCTILFNYAPLPKLLQNIGFGTAWFSVVMGVAFIVKHWVLSSALPEFTPIVVVMASCNAILAFVIGMLGLYTEKLCDSQSMNSTYKIGSVVKGE